MNIYNSRCQFLTAVFKCDICDKAFSTENYLNSHIKRRHTDENLISNKGEDKLQSEIKELKERLNSTDKLLQQINVSELPVVKNKIEENPLSQLEKKFCSFKEKVENEMLSLHLEKNMYEEKYNKLFDLMIQSKQNHNVVLENVGTMTLDNIDNNAEVKPSVHVSTQTEQQKQINLKQETIQILSLNDPQEINCHPQEPHHESLDEKLTTLNQDIDIKVS